MFLDPAKVLVILIVALVVLGPDKLPGVARQMGAAWGELRKFRQKLESEVRGTFPDLPSTQQVAQAVRSPLAFLDQLADAHEREQKGTVEPSPDSSYKPTVPALTEPVSAHNGTEPEIADKAVIESAPGDQPALGSGVSGSPPERRQIGRTRPWRAAQPAEPSVIPDDPSMN
jgi:sec-independent protein translocase protein TatB